MSDRMNGRFLVIGYLAALVIFSACASGSPNLIKDGRLKIETEAPEEITISVKGVYLKDELSEIKGVVWWQRGSPDELYSAHVDIEFVGSDGKTSTELGVPLRRIFLHRAIRQRARFSAVVEISGKEDATLRVIFHPGVHDDPAEASDIPASPPREGTQK